MKRQIAVISTQNIIFYEIKYRIFLKLSVVFTRYFISRFYF